MHKDTVELLRKVEAAGWAVELDGGDHFRCTPPGGGEYVTVPNSPSDHRSLLNVKAKFKRFGLDLDAQPRRKKGGPPGDAAQRRYDAAAKRAEEARLAAELEAATTKETSVSTKQKPDDYPVKSIKKVIGDLMTNGRSTTDEISARLDLHGSTVTRAGRWGVDQGLIAQDGKRNKTLIWGPTDFGLEWWKATEPQPAQEPESEPGPVQEPGAKPGPGPEPEPTDTTPDDRLPMLTGWLIEVGPEETDVQTAILTLINWIKRQT